MPRAAWGKRLGQPGAGAWGSLAVKIMDQTETEGPETGVRVSADAAAATAIAATTVQHHLDGREGHDEDDEAEALEDLAGR